VAIVFSEGVVQDNKEFKKLSFDVMVYVPLSEWILNDINLRPFLIMSEIEKSLKNKRVQSLGTIDYQGFEVTLITDAMRAKHMPDGDYELGGQPVIVKNGEARLHNGTLAGSVLRMNHAVRNVHKLAGIELTHVLDMASLNPAQNLGVSEERGSIKVGKYADFAVLDENFEVVMTIAEGRIIYQR
jgi:hypothetical protein